MASMWQDHFFTVLAESFNSVPVLYIGGDINILLVGVLVFMTDGRRVREICVPGYRLSVCALCVFPLAMIDKA
jgi:hypothetical protein